MIKDRAQIERAGEILRNGGLVAIPTETVYGFVPIELVEKLIQKHGGIVNVPDFDMED